MVRILILGGTGFIGREVVRALAGHDLFLFHRTPAESGRGEVVHIQGDRADLIAHHARFRRLSPDVVLDMTPQNAGDATRTVAAFEGLAGRAVAVSSLSVYRAFGRLLRTETCAVDVRALDEASPLRTRRFPYRGDRARARSDPKRWLDDYDKIPAEQVFLEADSLPASVVRLPLVYGPRDLDARVGAYVARLRSGRPFCFERTAAQWRNARDHVANVAHAIALVTLGGAPGRVYNAPGAHDLPERDWARAIAQAAGVRTPVEVGDRTGERPLIDEFPADADFRQHLRIDDTRIRAELGYREQVSMTHGLAETAAGIVAETSGRAP